MFTTAVRLCIRSHTALTHRIASERAEAATRLSKKLTTLTRFEIGAYDSVQCCTPLKNSKYPDIYVLTSNFFKF
jgi:hypothetical protein